jgi:hypothetical protein
MKDLSTHLRHTLGAIHSLPLEIDALSALSLSGALLRYISFLPEIPHQAIS